MTLPPVPQRQHALEEYLHILAGVYGDHPFTYKGETFSTSDAVIYPRPLQQPRPPLVIAGAGQKVTLRQVAQFADACSPAQARILAPSAVRMMSPSAFRY